MVKTNIRSGIEWTLIVHSLSTWDTKRRVSGGGKRDNHLQRHIFAAHNSHFVYFGFRKHKRAARKPQ